MESNEKFDRITCPCSEKMPLVRWETGFRCTSSQCIHSKEKFSFPSVNGIPRIISSTKTDTVCDESAEAVYVDRPFVGLTEIKRVLFGASPETSKNCIDFVSLVSESSQHPKILVIGGAEKGAGTEALWGATDLEITSSDIYQSPNVDIVFDAHYIPFEDEVFDGVWIQAVLEHVVEPEVVIAEIFRVLKFNGVVYAETPFMQQVHEGRFDFTRYTVLGHRYLFKHFEMVKVGGLNGANIALAWSIRYFVLSVTRSKVLARFIGLVAKLVLRTTSIFISKSSMYDSASAVFFLGRKLNNFEKITHKDLLALYKGDI